MKAIPNLDLQPVSEDVGDGSVVSYTPINLRLLLSVSIDEFELEEGVTARLRDHGITNLGKVASSARGRLASIVGCGDSMNEIDAEMCEVGLTYGMKFDPSVLSEDEYHIQADAGR